MPVAGSPLHPGTLRLEVVGGPFAGETVPIQRGAAITIGSSDSASLAIADPALAPQHATLAVSARRRSAGGPRGSRATVAGGIRRRRGLGERRADRPSVELVPADLLQLGSSMLRIGIAPRPDADLTRDALGARGFNRPSRIRPAKEQPVVQLPGDKPEDPDQSPMPWLSAIIPVVLGVTMAIVFGRAIMLLMAAASPIMVVGSFMANRRIAKKKGLKTEAQWIDEVKAAGRRIAELARIQRLEAWYRLPDPVVVADIATAPLARLWERRRGDDDALLLRVGVTEVALDVRFEGGGKDRSASPRVGVTPVPVAADVRKGVVGIAGPADATRSVARAMLTSFATLRSPRDAELMVICDAEDDDAWAGRSGCPTSSRAVPSPRCSATPTTAAASACVRPPSCSRTACAPQASAAPNFRATSSSIVDGAREYRMLPGMVPLLEHGSAHGIHVIALDSERARLPEEAKSVIVVDPSDPSLARFETGSEYFPTVLLDGVSLRRAEQIARSLCSIQHVSGVGDDAMLPTSVRMVDLLKIDLDDPAHLVRRWETQPRNTFVVVGANADGEFALDISRDGPHGLVAGTTGSGKSEFLQALVVSLAMANRPDALNFVLVDYKGGSAFEDCERLPHTVGMVTEPRRPRDRARARLARRRAEAPRAGARAT